MMHPLLRRQLLRFLSEKQAADIPGWEQFIAAVDDAYKSADEDREMIERSLGLMSLELRQRNQQLLQQLEEKNRAEADSIIVNEQLRTIVQQLENTQMQLLQADKMASVGQLAAGVAHEINNPMGYIHSNIATLGRYVKDMMALLHFCNENKPSWPDELRGIFEEKQEMHDYEYLKEDIPVLLQQTNDGITRVKKIVQDLRDFSHVDSGVTELTDIHKGIRSTLNIVSGEYKNKADIVCQWGELPMVDCNLGQLNQVFLNIIINACQSIEHHGSINISTGHEEDQIWIAIADNGTGIAPENIPHIFEAFYTTKPVGKGTGLGLSLSYGIIKAHHGHIDVRSTPGEGTTFTIWLPVRQPRAPQELSI